MGIEIGLPDGGARVRGPTLDVGEGRRARAEACSKAGEERGEEALDPVTADPCPFCTSSDVRPGVTEQRRVVVLCDDCGASGPVCINELNAVRSWNRRRAKPDQEWD
ncbi:restriction alleviation protein, Lar family [Mesorhizobium sp. M3A.F.Ca.ET.080.04.2.1]|nr:restriction alleviation protein, Lar family [Mesorhizobium sp. M3A.F.Ca.ET.080.04.2.1]RWF12341.1 MAG: restriction alleviation protein, Lar family [Mesorhizobium sp.]